MESPFKPEKNVRECYMVFNKILEFIVFIMKKMLFSRGRFAVIRASLAEWENDLHDSNDSSPTRDARVSSSGTRYSGRCSGRHTRVLVSYSQASNRDFIIESLVSHMTSSPSIYDRVASFTRDARISSPGTRYTGSCTGRHTRVLVSYSTDRNQFQNDLSQ